MKLPKYNSNRTFKHLIKTIKYNEWAVINGDVDGNWSTFDNLENHIVNFALEYLVLNLKDQASYEALYDYLKYNDPAADTSKFNKKA